MKNLTENAHQSEKHGTPFRSTEHVEMLKDYVRNTDIFPDKSATNLERPVSLILSPITVIEKRQLVSWQVRYPGSHGDHWIQECISHH